MEIADFTLERYFARWEFAVKYVLCASDAEPIALADLLALADDDSLRRWNSLKLGYTESLGLPALRDEIARLYRDLDADDIITFAGAEEGVFLAMHALLRAVTTPWSCGRRISRCTRWRDRSVHPSRWSRSIRVTGR